jgi:pilus assembly protein Flp/PilA
MSTFISAVKTFLADEEGVTALEYGLIAALIAAGIVTSVGGLADAVIATFDSIAGTMNEAVPG